MRPGKNRKRLKIKKGDEVLVIAGRNRGTRRAGMPIGCRVTLRRNRMWHFLDRLITVALPRVRDFRGISDRSFDGRGSYTLGIRDHLIFPEVDYSRSDGSKGINVTLVTSAESDAQALHLLRGLGMPFAS